MVAETRSVTAAREKASREKNSELPKTSSSGAGRNANSSTSNKSNSTNRIGGMKSSSSSKNGKSAAAILTQLDAQYHESTNEQKKKKMELLVKESANMLPRFSANASPDGMDVDSQQDKGDNSAEASAAEGNSAEGNNVEGNSAEGNNAERNGAKGKSAEGNNMEGNSAEGNNAERNGAEGNDAEGRGAEGNNAERNGAEGNGPMGKSAEGNNTEGSNSNNEDEGMFMPLDTDVEYGYNTEQEDEGVFMTDHVDDVFVIGETILHSPRNAEGEAVGYLKGRGGTLFIVHKHTIRLPNGTIAASKYVYEKAGTEDTVQGLEKAGLYNLSPTQQKSNRKIYSLQGFVLDTLNVDGDLGSYILRTRKKQEKRIRLKFGLKVKVRWGDEEAGGTSITSITTIKNHWPGSKNAWKDETILTEPLEYNGKTLLHAGNTILKVDLALIKTAITCEKRWQKYSKEYDQGGVLEGSVEPEPELKKYLNSLD